jgi:hypothetical protein
MRLGSSLRKTLHHRGHVDHRGTRGRAEGRRSSRFSVVSGKILGWYRRRESFAKVAGAATRHSEIAEIGRFVEEIAQGFLGQVGVLRLRRATRFAHRPASLRMTVDDGGVGGDEASG